MELDAYNIIVDQYINHIHFYIARGSIKNKSLENGNNKVKGIELNPKKILVMRERRVNLLIFYQQKNQQKDKIEFYSQNYHFNLIALLTCILNSTNDKSWKEEESIKNK